MHGIPTKAKSGPNPRICLCGCQYLVGHGPACQIKPGTDWCGWAQLRGKWALFAAACGIVLLRLPSAIQALSLMKPVQMSITGSLGIWGGTLRPLGQRGDSQRSKSENEAYRLMREQNRDLHTLRPDCPTSFSRAGWQRGSCGSMACASPHR